MVKNLKALRINAKISQKQLADVINVTQQSINKYENHDVEPNIETLISMSEYFNTSVDYLIGNSDIKNKAQKVERCDLNEHEQRLVDAFRTLSKNDKELILSFIERLRK